MGVADFETARMVFAGPDEVDMHGTTGIQGDRLADQNPMKLPRRRGLQRGHGVQASGQPEGERRHDAALHDMLANQRIGGIDQPALRNDHVLPP